MMLIADFPGGRLPRLSPPAAPRRALLLIILNLFLDLSLLHSVPLPLARSQLVPLLILVTTKNMIENTTPTAPLPLARL